jgi:NAD(P)-dependent dehydrogenase (short-subunit alcohol dehydrogenase family)
MRILLTGAGSNIGRGIAPRLRAAGHDLVLSDLNRLPDDLAYEGLPFVQADVQIGVGLERAAAGCDLILHLPAWHGVHWGSKTEADFWRLNVDGTFWAFQAARAVGITRFVFLSSQAWHGHYDKYGFTKRIGEELCEFHRQRGGVRYVAVRPADLTPYRDFLHYGVRLLYGGVDRDDVLDAVERSVAHLETPLAEGAEPQGRIVNAVRPNVFTEAQLAGWDDDPGAVLERLFPGAAQIVARYGLELGGRPHRTNVDEGDGRAIGYVPTRHFGTFLAELRRIEAEQGEAAVRALRCPYTGG